MFKKLTELPRVQHVVLLYGQSGSGKTFLASQFPKPAILACDPGELGGSRSVFTAIEKGLIKEPPLWLKVDSYQTLLQAIQELPKLIQAGEVKTIVVDSVSYMQRLVMDDILARIMREIPRFEEWNLCVERMRHLIRKITELGADVVFTATDNMQRDELTGKIVGGPNLPGKLAQELPQACGIVLRLFVTSGYNAQGKKEVVYKFQSAPDEMWYAKDTTGTLPAEGPVSIAPLLQILSGVKSEKKGGEQVCSLPYQTILV